MDIILPHILTRLPAGERLVLCTVVRARGSTPQGAGAKMLVLENGKTIGTLGGGCVEAEVRRRALEILPTGQSQVLSYKLDHDLGWDDGLICGGMLDVYAQILNPGSLPVFAALSQTLAAGEPGTFAFDYATPEGNKRYEEQIPPAPTLLIAGGGHVGLALAAIAPPLDFRVTIIDDRPEFSSLERFPTATTRITGEIELELSRYPITPQTYIVIVTRGHRGDGRALLAVARSNAAYIGLIGSNRKVRTIFGDLYAAGIPRETLYRIHAPIGLEIGAETVPEIALSIAAELVAVRRGRDGHAAPPMALGKDAINTWLEQARPESIL